jgi:hypothetical protein
MSFHEKEGDCQTLTLQLMVVEMNRVPDSTAVEPFLKLHAVALWPAGLEVAWMLE